MELNYYWSAITNSPVWRGSLLSPAHYGDGVIASQPLPGQVSEAVHPTVVEEQVGVDLHHGLDRALGQDLVHDVLHVPGRPLPGVPPAHPVGRLGPVDWAGQRLTAQPGGARQPEPVGQLGDF